MSKGCSNRGCKKFARHPSNFCRIHAALAVSVVRPRLRIKKPPSRSNSNSPTPYRKEKTAAYCKNYVVSHFNRPCLDAIQSTIFDFVATRSPRITGVRELIRVDAAALDELLPLLLSVTALASKVVAFPLKDPVIHAPLVVVAPPSSSHSVPWSKGRLHRDFECVETTGVYSFLLFLDEVTPDNGTVAFWRHSKLIGPIDARHPERALDQAGLKPELLVGEEGAVHVFDSRLLHRSLANRTQRRRVALQWLVTSARNGASISVST